MKLLAYTLSSSSLCNHILSKKLVFTGRISLEKG
ncbi:hypothetical protein NEOC65_002456 [Neochlamydia sp. AcF65]|nr:hypothetical protein [Neochlamydia sp. AcF65]MBS4171374.1 hypothetical protein [Neochlamydia sp. AcF95]